MHNTGVLILDISYIVIKITFLNYYRCYKNKGHFNTWTENISRAQNCF